MHQLILSRMHMFSRTRISLAIFGVLLAPAAALAANVDQLIWTPAEQVVSRGDFLRAAIEVLGMQNREVSNEELPYRRVSSGLEKYVRIAHDEDALGSFG